MIFQICKLEYFILMFTYVPDEEHVSSPIHIFAKVRLTQFFITSSSKECTYQFNWAQLHMRVGTHPFLAPFWGIVN